MSTVEANTVISQLINSFNASFYLSEKTCTSHFCPYTTGIRSTLGSKLKGEKGEELNKMKMKSKQQIYKEDLPLEVTVLTVPTTKPGRRRRGGILWAKSESSRLGLRKITGN